MVSVVPIHSVGATNSAELKEVQGGQSWIREPVSFTAPPSTAHFLPRCGFSLPQGQVQALGSREMGQRKVFVFMDSPVCGIALGERGGAKAFLVQ